LIWVIAGTEKGRIFIGKLLSSGYKVLATTATSYGGSLLAVHENLVVKNVPLSRDGMSILADEYKVRLIIDASHPYSEEVKANALHVSETAGIPLLELGRSHVAIPGAVEFDSYSDAADYLHDKAGNVLLTIGSKNLKYFRESEQQKIYARVLPLENSISQCAQSGFVPERIIAMKHIFSVEFEKALIREFDIKYLVTKESGAEGGVMEKAEAAAQCGVEVVMIRRPVREAEDIFYNMDELILRAGEIVNG
jgi:precorrin-6A/cobalt-precorrin-6A reductase